MDAESTPKPSKPSTPKPGPKSQTDSDSEFELSLDVDSPKKSDSDSEFELTLDDSSGQLEALEDEKKSSGEKDIFETDFDVPALEEESGSEAVAVEDAETDLGSSDFELASGEEDVAVEDESGSQVVALDEEEPVDDAAETVTAKSRAKKRKGRVAAAAVEVEEEPTGDFAELDEPMAEAEAEEDEEILDLEGEVVEETAGKKVIRQVVVLQPAPWGVFPVIGLGVCLVLMILLGVMGFELAQTQQGYKQGFLTRQLGGIVGQK